MRKSKANVSNSQMRSRREIMRRAMGNRWHRSMGHRLFRDESGQVLPWVTAAMVIMLASSALAVDVAHALVVQRQLQSSADAAALAAAADLPGTDYQTVGAAYGAGSGGKNTVNGVTVNSVTFTPLCLQTVKSWGVFCATSGSTVTVANAVRVVESGSVSTFFAGVFGVKTLNFNVTATASKGKPKAYNIALVVDSTLSMGESDSNCIINGSTVTQMTCALSGVQSLLGNLSTQFDRVALFTFPNVAAGWSGGTVSGWTPGTDNSGTYQCTTPIPSKYTLNGKSYSYPYDSSFGYYSILSGSTYYPPYSGAPWAMPYSFPPIPTSTSGYTPPTGTYGPTYEVVGFSTDYNTVNSDGTVSLNTASNLVKAVGGNSSCGGLEPSNYDGNYGTYYAGALYAAQAALLAEQANNPKFGNVMIILGDGNSTAPNDSNSPESASPAIPQTVSSNNPTTSEATTTFGTTSALNYTSFTLPTSYTLATNSAKYPSWLGECGQAVDAAQYAATYPSDSSNPTQVYTIAYGSPTTSSKRSYNSNGNCASDIGYGTHKSITPCQTMQQMASGSTSTYTSKYFYSDWAAQGGSSSSGCKASAANSGITAIGDIYRAIAASLTGTRLVPNDMN